MSHRPGLWLMSNGSAPVHLLTPAYITALRHCWKRAGAKWIVTAKTLAEVRRKAAAKRRGRRAT